MIRQFARRPLGESSAHVPGAAGTGRPPQHGRLLALQALAGNEAVANLLQRTRDDLLVAYDAAVKRSDWADVAIRMNGFNEGDIVDLTRKLTHSERVNVAVAARIHMAGWPEYVVPIMKKVDAAIDAGGDVKKLAAELPPLRQHRLALEAAAGSGLVETEKGPAAISEADRVAGLVEIRHRMMGMIAALQDSSPADRKVDDEIEAQVVAQEAVILGELRTAKLKPEFHHTDQAVQDKVLAALQLQVKRAARESVGDEGARKAWGSTGEWCGVYAYKKAASIGLDPTTASGVKDHSSHVDQLELLFTYQDAPSTWAWDEADSKWKSLAEYHNGRGAKRKYWVLPAPGGSTALVDPLRTSTDPKAHHYANWFKDHHLDEYYDAKGQFTPQPGDIVLKDLYGNVRPDHVTTAISYGSSDSSLRTVGGNEGEPSGVKESQSDLKVNSNTAPTVGRKVPDRIYSIGRWSIVDFETHTYAHGPQPTAAPGTVQRTACGGTLVARDVAAAPVRDHRADIGAGVSPEKTAQNVQSAVSDNDWQSAYLILDKGWMPGMLRALEYLDNRSQLAPLQDNFATKSSGTYVDRLKNAMLAVRYRSNPVLLPDNFFTFMNAFASGASDQADAIKEFIGGKQVFDNLNAAKLGSVATADDATSDAWSTTPGVKLPWPVVKRIAERRLALSPGLRQGKQLDLGRAGSDPAPGTSVQAGLTTRQKEIRLAVWQDLASEGGASAINTWDNMNVTWGRGFAGAQLDAVMKNLFTVDAGAKAEFRKLGVDHTGTAFIVVDTHDGTVRQQTDAVHLIKDDVRLLTFMRNLAEDARPGSANAGESHSQAVVDAQFKQMLAVAAHIPTWAETWSNDVICVVSHLTHWRPAYGWPKGTYYQDTNGDIKKVVYKIGRAMAHAHGVSGVYRVFEGEVLRDNNLLRWGRGVAQTGVFSGLPGVGLPDPSVGVPADRDSVFFPVIGMSNFKRVMPP